MQGIMQENQVERMFRFGLTTRREVIYARESVCTIPPYVSGSERGNGRLYILFIPVCG
jgi:hypothetical protein